MSSGDLFQEILNTMSRDGAMSQETRDSLILRGIISLYSEIGTLRDDVKELSKLMPLYRILVLIGGILISLIIGLLFEIFTGKVTIHF